MKQTHGSDSLEWLSALADGQLHGEEFAHALGEAAAQDALRARWQIYHLVGDVLRSGAHSPCAESGAFVARLRQRMAQESVQRPGVPAQAVPAAVLRPTEAANEPAFRWKMVAGVATVAAAAAIGWTWLGQGPAPVSSGGAQLARQAAPVPSVPAAGEHEVAILAASTASPVASPAPAVGQSRVIVGNGSPQIMLRDPRLDELLEAHQQVNGASQMPAGFLRNATFEGPAR